MAYKVELSKRAQRDLAGLEKADRDRVVLVLRTLESEPRPDGCRKLKGKHDGSYRVRAGSDFRVVYDVNDSVRSVLVLRIGNRREVYAR